jgi:hypothetical protein
MLKKLFILITLAVAGTTSFAQIVHPDLIGKKIAVAIKQENQLKSKIYKGGGDILTPKDMAFPIRYIRQEKNIPHLIVQYTFSKNDSVIHNIEYEWDVRNFDESDHIVKPISFDKALIERYNSLLAYFTKKYGPGTTKGDLTDLAKIDSLGGLTRTDRWNANGEVDVLMYTAISNYYQALPGVTRIPTHRIRVYMAKPRD